MSQTSYSFYLSAPFAGALAEYGQGIDIRSYVSEEATLGLPFGIAVMQGTDDNGCLLPTSSGAKILGLTVHQHAQDPYFLPASPSTAGVPLKGTVGVLRRGRMYVLPEVSVVPHDPVYARYTASGGNTQLGALRNDGDSSKALQISQAEFLTTASAAAAAIVDINVP